MFMAADLLGFTQLEVSPAIEVSDYMAFDEGAWEEFSPQLVMAGNCNPGSSGLAMYVVMIV